MSYYWSGVMSNIWKPPSIALAHSSLFTSEELRRFEEEILSNPTATEHDASRFFSNFPKFLYLGRGAEVRREVVLYRKAGEPTQRVDFFRRNYGNHFWDIIEIKHPNSPFITGEKTKHPHLSSEVNNAINQAQDYRLAIDEDSGLRADLKNKGILVYHPQIIVVVGKHNDALPLESLRILYDRVNQRGGIEAFTYEDIYHFAKEHYEAHQSIFVTLAYFHIQSKPTAIAVLRGSSDVPDSIPDSLRELVESHFAYDIPDDIQRKAIQNYAESLGISIIETLQDVSFGSLRQYLDTHTVDAVVTYRFDCITSEYSDDLGSVGDYFTRRGISLHSITEDVEFTSGYRGTDPKITSRTDRSSVEERQRRITALRKLFSSRVAGSDGTGIKCIICGSGIKVHDQFHGGGGVDYYAPLYSCDKCGWYEIDGEYWTTDY
jgi:hypothetical protein